MALVPDAAADTSAGLPPPAGLSAVIRGDALPVALTPDADVLADPDLQPALHRLAEADVPASAGDSDAGEPDELVLLRRAGRYLMIAPLALRIVVLSAATCTLLAVYGTTHLHVLVTVVGVLAVVDLGVLLVLRHEGDRTPGLRPAALVGGLLLALGANLAVAATVPPSLYLASTAVTGAYLVGTVALWTVTLGWRRALLPVVLDVPLQVAMAQLLGAGRPGAHVPHLVAFDVAGVIGLALAMVAALMALFVVGLGNRLYLVAGIRAGQHTERARMLRGLHDTVLQTLETIAMGAPDDRARPAQTLARIRAMARAQAVEIRRTLGRAGAPERSEDLLDDLEALVTESAASGLRVELVCDDLEQLPVDPTVRAALRDAVREALRNVQKHAQVDAAVVRVERLPSLVVATIRDHGVGFVVDEQAGGFGLTHSVGARLAELGGSAEITSRPGRGTRVQLCLPVPDPQP